MALEVGRVCMKTAGREAGKYCVVLKKMDNNFVLITGPKPLTHVKRRRCNVEHLEPTSYTVKIGVEASDSEVMSAYEKSGLFTKLGLRKPSPEVIKKAEKVKKPKKEVKKVEKKIEKPPKKKPEVKKPEKEIPKVEEKPKKVKKPLTIKLKIPTFRRKKKEKKKKPEKKKVKKAKKKPEKKTKKKEKKKPVKKKKKKKKK